MPSEIVAVLVVPAEGDPGGLLAEGRAPDGRWRLIDDDDPSGWFPDPPDPAVLSFWQASPPCVNLGLDHKPIHTLPLWWDGKLVPEGWDRARRALCSGDEISYPHIRGIFTPAGLPSVEVLGRILVSARLASRVVRLTRDDSGRLVEVPVGT